MALKLALQHPNGSTAEYHKIGRITCEPGHRLEVFILHYKDEAYRTADAPPAWESVEYWSWPEWDAAYLGSWGEGLYALLKERVEYAGAEDVLDAPVIDRLEIGPDESMASEEAAP